MHRFAQLAAASMKQISPSDIIRYQHGKNSGVTHIQNHFGGTP
jgi:hypothetical protein